jgi:hypothetical protein
VPEKNGSSGRTRTYNPLINRTEHDRQFNYFAAQMTTFSAVRNQWVTSGARICNPYLTRTNLGIRVTITSSKLLLNRFRSFTQDLQIPRVSEDAGSALSRDLLDYTEANQAIQSNRHCGNG